MAHISVIILIIPTPLGQLVCMEQEQKEQVCPVREAGSANNKHLRKGSWVRRGVEDVKLAENEKKVVGRETGTKEGEERISSVTA